jgi:hypothetical protein
MVVLTDLKNRACSVSTLIRVRFNDPSSGSDFVQNILDASNSFFHSCHKIAEFGPGTGS